MTPWYPLSHAWLLTSDEPQQASSAVSLCVCFCVCNIFLVSAPRVVVSRRSIFMGSQLHGGRNLHYLRKCWTGRGARTVWACFVFLGWDVTLPYPSLRWVFLMGVSFLCSFEIIWATSEQVLFISNTNLITPTSLNYLCVSTAEGRCVYGRAPCSESRNISYAVQSTDNCKKFEKKRKTEVSALE